MASLHSLAQECSSRCCFGRVECLASAFAFAGDPENTSSFPCPMDVVGSWSARSVNDRRMIRKWFAYVPHALCVAVLKHDQHPEVWHYRIACYFYPVVSFSSFSPHCWICEPVHLWIVVWWKSSWRPELGAFNRQLAVRQILTLQRGEVTWDWKPYTRGDYLTMSDHCRENGLIPRWSATQPYGCARCSREPFLAAQKCPFCSGTQWCGATGVPFLS